MSKQLLIYENVAALSSNKHRKLSIKRTDDFSFAAGVNSVPLTAIEFGPAGMEYPIVFAGEGDNVTPVAVLGIQNDTNLFVNADKQWTGNYIPAFVRRYPFVFASNDQGKTFTLCLDESYAGCNEEGRGENLFDADGNQTAYLKGVLGFLQEYQAHFQVTQNFCRKLVELNLLESMRAQFRLPSGQEVSLSGFMVVNRQRLQELSADKLKELVLSGELELIYRHLHSIAHIDRLGRMLGESEPAAAADEETGTQH